MPKESRTFMNTSLTTEIPLQNLPQPAGRALLSSNDSRALGRLRRHVGRAQLGHRIRILLRLVCRSISTSISVSVLVATAVPAASSTRGAGLLRARSPGRLRVSGSLVPGGTRRLGLP